MHKYKASLSSVACHGVTFVYLSGSHSLCVERIYFDADYWNNRLLPKLTSFYFKHAINIAFLKKKRMYSQTNVTIWDTYQSAGCTKVMTFNFLIFAYLYIFITVEMSQSNQFFCFCLLSYSSIRYSFSLSLEVQILKPLEILRSY